jgi:hypothetical protein
MGLEHFAKYGSTPVFIEWEGIVTDETGAGVVQIGNRVAALATLLAVNKPQTFRSLACIGSFKDVRSLRYRFLYRLTSGVTTESPQRSLLEILYDNSFLQSVSSSMELCTQYMHNFTSPLHIELDAQRYLLKQRYILQISRRDFVEPV